MLFRSTDRGVIAITQPAHSWISGQLARAWGTEQFRLFSPHEDVCLAAELHDIGWINWEARPTLNAATGRPHAFFEMPREHHLAIWDHARTYAQTFGRYVALLVSMHGTGLYDRFGIREDEPEEIKTRVHTFMHAEKEWQEQTRELLATDSVYQEYVRTETVQANRSLIATWDALSLSLCGGVTKLHSIPTTDINNREVELMLTPAPDDQHVRISPWPFTESPINLTLQGRLLTSTVATETRLHEQLNDAPWVTLEINLKSGETEENDRYTNSFRQV